LENLGTLKEFFYKISVNTYDLLTQAFSRIIL